jgi:PPOX class probable F420-dependent enzyme
MTDPQAEGKLLALIAGSRQGVLATIAADGRPQLSNVLYVWDAVTRTARISTTADRVKPRNVQRDPRAALHVSGDHFWQFVVGEGPVTVSSVATEPGDDATRELLEVHGGHYGELDGEKVTAQLIAGRRLVIRLHIHHTYGIALDKPPGG